ncbi:HSS1_3 [Sanghuangporus baumii]
MITGRWCATVTEAVITVPAYFNDSQCYAVKDASIIAGINALRIIEPTTAAIAQGLDKKVQGKRNVLIFSFGGGTFDVSLLTVELGIFEVKPTASDTQLPCVPLCSGVQAQEQERVYLSLNPHTLRQLRTACECAKRALSSAVQTTIEIDSLYEGIDFYISITRTIQGAVPGQDLFHSALESVEKIIRDSKIDRSKDIHENETVWNFGCVDFCVSSHFFNGKEPCKSINPDEAVAYGAAVQAVILENHALQRTQDVLLYVS